MKKSENLWDISTSKGLSTNTMHSLIQSRETVPLNVFLHAAFLKIMLIQGKGQLSFIFAH
jgi:hypothetical protein